MKFSHKPSKQAIPSCYDNIVVKLFLYINIALVYIIVNKMMDSSVINIPCIVREIGVGDN